MNGLMFFDQPKNTPLPARIQAGIREYSAKMGKDPKAVYVNPAESLDGLNSPIPVRMTKSVLRFHIVVGE